jgi:hypothetical protein
MKNKKKSLDKDVHNLRQLLRENILTSSSGNNTKYSKNFYTKTSSNIFKHNNSNNMIITHKAKKEFSFSMLKYKPKRLINFKGIHIPLPSLGKASIDYSKTLGGLDNKSEIKNTKADSMNNFKTISTMSNQNEIKRMIEDENHLIEFKNIYILKYAQYSDSLGKFYPYKELISDARKRDFENLFKKITKNMESQSQLLLDDYDSEKKMSNKNKSNTNIFVNPFATIIPPSKTNEKKNDQLVAKMKIIEICSNFNNFIIKFMNLLFREIKEYKNEIIKLVKNNHEQNLKINLLMKELDDLKNYLNKYDINKKICGEKAKENSIKRIKDKFIQKENEYIVCMYNLRNEISSLMQLSDKNKDYYNKYKDAESQINNNKKKNDILRMNFNKELNERNLQVAIEKDKREELMNNLEELNEIIKELKDQKEKQKRQEIESTAQILKLRIINDEKNESLMMMSEELEHYIREYNKEKNNYEKTLSDLRALENKFYRDSEEEKDK